MTERESAVAAEILRMAREDLGLRGDTASGGPLAGALDSLELLALVVAVEDRFRMVLDDADAASTHTLEDLARLVVARADPACLPAPSAPSAAGEAAPP